MILYNLMELGNQICYKGGGGSSGAVSFPAHMESRHTDWLGTTPVVTTVSELINAGTASNPLELLSYEDPDAAETKLDTEMSALETYIKTGDATTDYNEAVTDAVAKLDAAGVLTEIDAAAIVTAARTSTGTTLTAAISDALAAIDETKLQAAVTSFVNARTVERATGRARYKGNMSSLNAERSSAYAIGLALIEIDFDRQTSEYQTQLSTQMYQQGLQIFTQSMANEIQARVQAEARNKQARDQLLAQSIQTHLTYKQFLFELRKATVQTQGEVNRLNFVMDSEYVGNTADLNWKYASWDMNVFQAGTNVLGGIGGGSYVPEGPTKAGSAIGGALSGAATGAALGSAVPGLGTAVGAGIGAAAGGLAGLFG